MRFKSIFIALTAVVGLFPHTCDAREALLSWLGSQGNSTCDESCEPCLHDSCSTPACWRLQVSNVLMTRNTPRDLPLLTNAAGDVLLNANQFDFGIKSGIDSDVRRSLNQDWDLDLRYLWISEFKSPSVVNVSDDLNLFPGVFSVVPVSGRTAFEATYRSGIQTAEINARRKYCDFGILAGFRFVELNEQLSETVINQFNNVLAEGAQGFATKNRLFGFQIGGDTVLWQNCRGIRVDSFAKAGIYGNQATSDYTFGVAGGGVFNATSSTDRKDQVSFLGELGVLGVLPMTKHISLRGGYQMMWVEGVALAVEQPRNFVVGTAPNFFQTLVDSSGGLFYHGSNAGLEFTW